MVAVHEISWEEASAPDFETTTRRAWREAVAEIAAKAHEKLPECNGRIDAAVKIVLAGDVELQADGTAKVASQSNGSTAYHVVNGHCDCMDFAKAPHSLCKHRLSAAIARRAQELVKAKLADTNGQTEPVQPQPTPAPLPEAPASVNCHITMAGRQVQVTLRDSDEQRLLARLAALLRQYPMPNAAAGATEIPVCPWHGAMKPSTKGKGYYCPAKMADGSYCKERAPK